MRFSAKIDIGSIVPLTNRIARNESMIVAPPTASGSSAATTLRNTNSDSRKRIGKASSSARAMSSETWAPTWSRAMSLPPTLTPGMRSSRGCTRSSAPRGSDVKVAAT